MLEYVLLVAYATGEVRVRQSISRGAADEDRDSPFTQGAQQLYPMTSSRPEDVPGAILRHPESLENHSVLELQRWLECRGLKKVGSKVELIARIQNCIKAGNGDRIFLGVDQGKWYDAKARILQQASTSSSSSLCNPLLDAIVWGHFPSHDLPKYFNKGHIYTYIVGNNVENEDPEMQDISENNTVTTVKPFRKGHQFVDSDHISCVEDGLQDNFYVCRCKCLSSFQKTLQYKVKVILNNTSGAVINGFCECKQSALGKCSHVTAFLLFIWQYVEKFGHVQKSSTSLPRQWGLGTMKRNPATVKSTKYNIKRFKPLDRAQYDPRPTGYTKEFDINSFVTDLQRVGNNSMFQSIFHLEYMDFEYSESELNVLKIQTQQFLHNFTKYMKTFGIAHGTNKLFEVPNTSPQGNDEWLKWRSYFITSSNAKVVATQLKSQSAKKTFF
ncbi:unnamed protein product [Phaedon cochleariae]|uniref:SAP domain-containing protein n=1 Tax=Phaedon cochleariae TaxID=80249 RepID=A0A9N9X1X2_PHACE|nr:unnamed protein product [Phaedon cochleariae]